MKKRLDSNIEWKLLNNIYLNIIELLSPASEASMGVDWNQAQKNFTHLHTEYPKYVTLFFCKNDPYLIRRNLVRLRVISEYYRRVAYNWLIIYPKTTYNSKIVNFTLK